MLNLDIFPNGELYFGRQNILLDGSVENYKFIRFSGLSSASSHGNIA